MRIKSQTEFGAGLMFVGLGLAFALGATNFSFGSSASPGAGYFPFGLGVVLALLGGVVLFQSLTLETPDGCPIGAIAWKPLLVVVGSVVLFGLALPRLGLVATLPLVVALASLAGDEFRWQEAALNAVALTALCWVVFVWALKLTIPVWPSFIGA